MLKVFVIGGRVGRLGTAAGSNLHEVWLRDALPGYGALRLVGTVDAKRYTQ